MLKRAVITSVVLALLSSGGFRSQIASSSSCDVGYVVLMLLGAGDARTHPGDWASNQRVARQGVARQRLDVAPALPAHHVTAAARLHGELFRPDAEDFFLIACNAFPWQRVADAPWEGPLMTTTWWVWPYDITSRWSTLRGLYWLYIKLVTTATSLDIVTPTGGSTMSA